MNIEYRTGRIYNIQSFSLHDGPGLREMVFLKGCPLKCQWCANPESQSMEKQLIYRDRSCIRCGYCISHCHAGALAMEENLVRIDRDRCDRCFQCVDGCYSRALECVGEDITTGELVKRIQSRRYGWRGSDGVTLSGGEPLMQPEFSAELLELLKDEGIHTAVETSAYGDYPVFRKIAALCDTVFCDLKIMDEERHRTYTGVGNGRILENIRQFSYDFPGKQLIIRTPLLQGINDDEENLEETVAYLNSLHHVSDYELLPYHQLGLVKYRQLGIPYRLEEVPAGEKEAVSALNDRLRSRISSIKKGGTES